MRTVLRWGGLDQGTYDAHHVHCVEVEVRYIYATSGSLYITLACEPVRIVPSNDPDHGDLWLFGSAATEAGELRALAVQGLAKA